jgi:hypothetical protein
VVEPYIFNCLGSFECLIDPVAQLQQRRNILIDAQRTDGRPVVVPDKDRAGPQDLPRLGAGFVVRHVFEVVTLEQMDPQVVQGVTNLSARDLRIRDGDDGMISLPQIVQHDLGRMPEQLTQRVGET